MIFCCRNGARTNHFAVIDAHFRCPLLTEEEAAICKWNALHMHYCSQTATTCVYTVGCQSVISDNLAPHHAHKIRVEEGGHFGHVHDSQIPTSYISVPFHTCWTYLISYPRHSTPNGLVWLFDSSISERAGDGKQIGRKVSCPEARPAGQMSPTYRASELKSQTCFSSSFLFRKQMGRVCACVLADR